MLELLLQIKRGFYYYGVLAQLGEHNAGSVEVRGSNPLHSTIKQQINIQNALSLSNVNF